MKNCRKVGVLEVPVKMRFSYPPKTGIVVVNTPKSDPETVRKIKILSEIAEKSEETLRSWEVVTI